MHSRWGKCVTYLLQPVEVEPLLVVVVVADLVDVVDDFVVVVVVVVVFVVVVVVEPFGWHCQYQSEGRKDFSTAVRNPSIGWSYS